MAQPLLDSSQGEAQRGRGTLNRARASESVAAGRSLLLLEEAALACVWACLGREAATRYPRAKHLGHNEPDAAVIDDCGA